MEENTAVLNEALSESRPAPKHKRSAAVYIILAVIILLQLGYTIFCYATKKTGSYGDEIWSYGLANSYYKPFIYLKEGVWMREETPEMLDNYGEWVDGEVMKDYITVQPEQRFSYGSVVSNQTFDNHPPLYYILLHTVCSFFPDSFSYSYAFFLNCILLVINGIFIFKLGETVLGSDKKGLLLCAFYAASTGGLSTFVFLRQYSLLTTLNVCYVYFNARLFKYELTAGKDDTAGLRKTLPFIMLTGILTFFTHYFAVPFVGLLTFLMCVMFLCRGRVKKMFIYGFGVLLTLGLFIALFPAAIKHTIGSDTTHYNLKDMGDAFELKYLASILLRYSVGLKLSLLETDNLTYFIVGIVLAAAVIVPAGFLFRREKWFAPVKERLKSAGKYYAGALSRADIFVLFLIIDIAVMTAVISKETLVYYFQGLAARYVFYLMPFTCLIMIIIIEKLLCVSKHIRRFIIPVTAAICAALCIRMHVKWDCPFYLRSVGGIKETAELLDGKNCLVVINGDVGDTKLTEAFPPYIYKTNSFYFVLEAELEAYKDDIISSQVNIDYVFVPAAWYALDNGQYAKIRQVMDERGEYYNENKINTLNDLPVGDMLPKYQECRSAFDDICGDCEPQLFFNINMGYYYLMKCR